MAAMVMPVVGLAGPASVSAAPSTPVAVYDAIGATVNGNVPSVGFQATQTKEIGDLVRLAAGPRALASVTVVMSSWACQSGTWDAGTCSTAPNATFDHPLTLDVYAVSGTDAAPTLASSTPIATVTQTFAIPFRPSADNVNCTGGNAGKWYDPAAATCYNGRATPVTFTFPGTTVLPSRIIWSIAYNTTSYGVAPLTTSAACFSTTQGCPYDSLNVGTLSVPNAPFAGTDIDESAQFRSSLTAGQYCDNGIAGTGVLRNDPGCNSGYRPMARIVTTSVDSTSTVKVVDGLHSYGWRFIDDNNDANPLLPSSFVSGPDTTPLGSGSAQLTVVDPADRQIVATARHAGTKLANLTALNYSIYQPAWSAGSVYTMALQFDVQYQTTNTGYQGRLVYEPSLNAPVVAGWQGIHTLNGKWWASKTTAAGSNGLCGQNAPCSWAQVLANWPDASIRGNLLVRAGGGNWLPFVGNVDAVTVGVDDGVGNINETTYDFESNVPAVLPITQHTVLSNQIGGENSNAQVWNADHFEPKLPGVESVVQNALPTAAGGAVASLTNGNLKLITASNEQARVVDNFAPATAPTLRDLLAQRPQYSVYTDSTVSVPNNVSPPSGNLQFGVQCGASWLMSVVMSPSDLPGTKDIAGNLPTWDQWQTFRYPDPSDATQKVFVATDAGTAPAGLAGFTAVSITSLIDICGDYKVIDARASQGRSSYTKVVSYLDDLQFSGNNYDFVFVTPTTPAAITTQVFGNTIGGENNTSAEWSYDHLEPKVPGTESVVTDAKPTLAADGVASLLNGSLKLHTRGFANTTLSQQARAVHTFDPAAAPTLNEIIYSRPQYSVYLDGSGSTPVDAPGAGNLQFGVQCGSWLASVLISPTDAPGTTDIHGVLPGFNTWQTFRYPDPADPDAKVFVATDGGTAPAGFGGFTLVSLGDLLDRCGNATVIDARASQGRNSYADVTSYLDDLTFLGHTYDFVTNIAPTITSGAPGNGVVGTPYSFAFTASGTPAPTITVKGKLPAGLTLNASGVLSGTPTASGTSTFLVTAANGVVPNDIALVSLTIDPDVASAGPALAPATPVAVAPARVLDTRTGTIPASGSTTKLRVTGSNGVPANAQAVFLNVTATGATGPGFITVWAADTARPDTSNLNVEAAGQSIPNMVVTPVSPSGEVELFVQTSTHLVVDVMGYIPVGVGYTPIAPARALDTRDTTRPADGATTVVKVTDVPGAPANPTAVIMNVTAVKSSGPGYVTVWPTSQDQPKTSNLNMDRAGQTRPNLVIVPVGPDGKVSLYQQTSADLVVDVVGFLTAEANYNTIQPSARLLDTRTPTVGYSGPKPAAGATVKVNVAGVGAIPSDAKYVIVNVTADQPTGAGYVSVFPGNTAVPTASNLNLDGPSSVASNLAFVPVGADGSIDIYTQSGTHLVLDVFGWVS